MIKRVVMAAVAGLSSGAIAGPAETMSLTLDTVASLDTTGGATILIDVIGDSSFGTHLLGGQLNLSSSDAGSIVTDIRWHPENWSTINGPGSYDGAGNYNGAIFGQFVVFTDLFDFLPANGSELGQRIGTFEVDLLQFCGAIDFHITADPDPDRFLLQVADVDFDARTTTFLNSNEADLSLNGVSIQVTPTPASLALLSFGGFAATRRRR